MFVGWFMAEIVANRTEWHRSIVSMHSKRSAGKSSNRRWDKVGGELIKVALRKFGDFGDR